MEIKKKLESLLLRVLRELGDEGNRRFEGKVKLEHPTEENHGDYSTSIALRLGGGVELAEKIVEKMREMGDLREPVEKIEVAKPGFINFWLASDTLKTELGEILGMSEKYGMTRVPTERFEMYENTQPNTNKPLHIGHLRNQALALAIVRLRRAIGHNVWSVNINNDRGIHIVKSMMGYLFTGTKNMDKRLANLDFKDRHGFIQGLIAQFRSADSWDDRLQEWFESRQNWVTPETTLYKKGKKPDHFIGAYYIDSGYFEEHFTNFGDYLQEMLQAWEAGDKRVRELWEMMNTWFYEGFRQTQERFGGWFEKEWYESEIYEGGKKIILEGVGKGVFYKDEKGAIRADLKKYGLNDPVVLRADGTAIYMTQDIELARLRLSEGADLLAYVVGNEQDLHFKQLFAICDALGFKGLKNYMHISYGMVRLKTGAMSSRLGTVINADDFMQDMVDKAQNIINEARIKKEVEDTVTDFAEAIGLGAIKYSMLTYSHKQDIVFDPETSISFGGNSGPYLQYTFARAQSILRKSGLTDNQMSDSQTFRSCLSADRSDKSGGLTSGNLASEELTLLRYLYRFPEVVEEAARSFSPNLVCNYLFEVAQKYNTFYNKHRILNPKSKSKNPNLTFDIENLDLTEKFRLALTAATGQILKNGLGLLGIEAPDRM